MTPISVMAWTYHDGKGQRFIVLPEDAERLSEEGFKLTPLYTLDNARAVQELEQEVWRISPNVFTVEIEGGQKADPFEGPGETYREAYNRTQQALERMTERAARYANGLEKAASRFDWYAELHAAKGTPDGDEKAQRNREFAAEAREAAREKLEEMTCP